jgi:hypothetical protein
VDRPAASDGRTSAASLRIVPPVLQNFEPSDNVLVLLPGPAPAPVSVKVAPPPVPVTTPPSIVETAEPRELAIDLPRPFLRRTNLVLPPDLEKDSAVFCKARIGQWTEAEARKLLGEPLRQRPAFDDNQEENGTIYAFEDPSGHYRNIELDFEAKTATLRTVFVYPAKMTWRECRDRWGVEVTSTGAGQGRTFYSYLNLRLDVLADKTGRVISLGWY